jgi:hypothetical protein
MMWPSSWDSASARCVGLGAYDNLDNDNDNDNDNDRS